jgi:glycosyltransferase involved in cell wall biosynthesis
VWDSIHIIVGTLNARGGRELLALAFTRFFIEHRLGKRIILYTKDEPNSLIVSAFPLEFVSTLRHTIFRPLGLLYSRKLWRGMLHVRIVQNMLSLSNSRSLTINLNADSIPIPAHICYVHFPYFSMGENIDLRSKVRKMVHLWSLRICKLIFVNSTYTKSILCRMDRDICGKVYVLYPPIPIRPMDKNSFIESIGKRRNIVLTVSRFSREKRIETIIDIAKNVNEGEFIIVGSLVDNDYYIYLKRIIEKERVHNIRLQPNISFEELHSLRTKSKVYLHPMPHEHFGISIVEAMASGCVPIVHRSGGPWHDILEHKEVYGYAYSSVAEAAAKIKMLLDDPKHYIEKALLALERSKIFTYQKFDERLHKLLANLDLNVSSSRKEKGVLGYDTF